MAQSVSTIVETASQNGNRSNYLLEIRRLESGREVGIIELQPFDIRLLSHTLLDCFQALEHRVRIYSHLKYVTLQSEVVFSW